jgi:uncharacterized membrane protein YGL010W
MLQCLSQTLLVVVKCQVAYCLKQLQFTLLKKGVFILPVFVIICIFGSRSYECTLFETSWIAEKLTPSSK